MTLTLSASLHGCRNICAGSTSRSGSGLALSVMNLAPGQKFGMLTAVEHVGYYSHPVAGRTPIWKWRCDCGGTTEAQAKNVKSGHTKSCGCLSAKTLALRHEQNKTHGDAVRGGEHPLYVVWKGIKRRCENPDYPQFYLYGGRGIKVLWISYEAFKQDMASGYKCGLQIDRIDNDGHYCKENCRWATPIQQANNRRTNRLIEFEGETHSMAEWARETGIPASTIRDRLNDGWTMNRIMAQRVMELAGENE